jgi:anti-sigma regulatory factor (Ser/Thr protein kinase)
MKTSYCSEKVARFNSENEPDQTKLPSAEGIKNYVSQSSSSFGRLVQGTFELRTHEEAERLSAMLALNTVIPERASVGFWELLSNAIEHGNLAIDMDLKTELLLQGTFEGEIALRHNLAEYRDRYVTVEFSAQPKKVFLKVMDQGEGFDYEKILTQEITHDRPNGRGIMLAQQFGFDQLEYLGKGNVVEGSIFID